MNSNNNIKKFDYENYQAPLTFITYNKKNHAELLKLEQFYKESSDHKFAISLINHRIVLTDHLNWECHDIYLKLLEDFLNKKIQKIELHMALEKRMRVMDEVVTMLESKEILLSPDKNSFEFGILLQPIIEDCDDSFQMPDYPGGMSDSEFENLVEKTYVQLKKLTEM